jgi:hypothetical protein
LVSQPTANSQQPTANSQQPTANSQQLAAGRDRGDVRTISGARTIDRKRDVGGAAVVVGKGESFTHFYLSCIPIRRSESL